ncbi:TPA: tape measure protein [Pseudomonas aeruginosa]
MADVQIRLTADLDEASREISGFRKTYAEMAREIEKPLRQVNSFRQLESSLESTERQMRSARDRVRELGNELARTSTPSKALQGDYRAATQELARLERQQQSQITKLSLMRSELQRTGVDTRNLVAEQQRLAATLGQRMGAGRADLAMNTSLDRLGINRLRELKAHLVRLQQDYQRLSRAGVLSATERAAAEIQYRNQLKATQAQIREIQTGSSAGGVGALVGRAAGAAAILYTIKSVAGAYFNVADAVGELSDRLRNATAGEEEFNQVLDRLRANADRTYTQFADGAELFLSAIRPLQEQGFSTDEVLRFTETLSAGLVASGTKGEQATAVINNLSKALQTGTLRGDAFNAVIQTSPELAQALADGLGVTRAELIKMAQAGELTTEKVIPALNRQYEQLTEKVDNMRVTVSDASTRFGNAMDRIIGKLDDVTGASNAMASSINAAAEALNGLADGNDVLSNTSRLANQAVGSVAIMPASFKAAAAALSSWAYIYRKAAGETEDATRQSSDRINSIVAAYNQRQAELRRQNLSNLKEMAAAQVKEAEGAAKKQAEAERKALDAVKKVRAERLAIETKYRDTLAQLTGGGTGDASYSSASALKVEARNALQRGDAEGALKLAEQARQMLLDMQKAGQSTYGLAGFAKELEQIELAANGLQQSKADTKLQQVKDEIEALAKAAEKVKNLTITPSMDKQAEQEAEQAVKALAERLGNLLVLKPTVEADASSMVTPVPGASSTLDTLAGGKPSLKDLSKRSDFNPDMLKVKASVEPELDKNALAQAKTEAEQQFAEGGGPTVTVGSELDEGAASETQAAVQSFTDSIPKQVEIAVVPKFYGEAGNWSQFPSGQQPPGFAGGGRINGPGTETSDSILARLSRGEFVVRASAVRHYGPEVLERLNSLRIPKFADGGRVNIPRLLPSIPEVSPALLQQASPGPMENMGSLTLNLGGDDAGFTVFGTHDTLRDIRKAASKFGRTRPK